MINLITIDGSGRKVARPVTNREDYLAQRNAPENVQNFLSARGGDKKAKARQVQYNYNDLLPDGVLKGCHHVASTFAHDIDCQSAEEQERIKQVLLEKKDAIGLLELSGSANYGLHAVCRRERGKTILENQVRLSMLTETEMDTSTHDEQRILYTGPATPDNLFYLDDAIFEEQLSPEEAAEEFLQLKERERQGQEEVPPGAKKANKHYRPWKERRAEREGAPHSAPERAPLSSPEGDTNASSAATNATIVNTNNGGQTRGSAPTVDDTTAVGVSDRTRFIAQGVMKEKGLLERDFLDEGGRHTSVKMFLSGATQLLTREETNGILAELMPDHWHDQNIQQLVSDFYQNYTNPSQRLLKYQENLFTQSRRLYGYDSEDGHTAASDAIVSPSGDDGGAPEMPRKLPKLIQLLTSKTPDVYKPAVSHAVFPALGAHLCKTRFRYIDNVEHEATLMNVLMAGTGAGKDCISGPINHIMADIRRRDAENLAREKAWKDEVNRRGANKDKRQRPEGLVIQEIDADMTGPAFVMRMAEADEHFLYTKLNEIDQFDALKGNGRGGQQFQIMCLAFDPDNRYGQTRVGTQSVTEKVCVRFNWNATTTILKGQRYFQNVLTDGPISRINFCTIPEREIGADIPIYGTYDAEFDEELRPYIERLCAARGTIDCPQAFKLAKKLKEECADFARLSQSRVYENLSFRALVIAYLKACVLFVANNYKWDKTMEDFIRWSLQYDLWCKMQFFGEAIEQANNDTTSSNRRGPRNLLELLPDVFTIDDARRVRQKQGLSNEYKKCRKMIDQWVSRKYVARVTDHSFKKCR